MNLNSHVQEQNYWFWTITATLTTLSIVTVSFGYWFLRTRGIIPARPIYSSEKHH